MISISMTSNSGFLLVLSAGVFWAVLGIVVAFGKSCNAASALVQHFAGILILVFAGWTVLLAEPFHWNAAVVIQILLILIVGICNYFMLNLVQRGMRSGREGVVWAFTQSSMICPFALSIALVFLASCLKTAPGRMSWGAFTALMGGIILLAA